MKTTRKPLPNDCLLGGRVHPSIAERLERIKQLPVAAVANFLSIEPSSNGFDLVWQAVDAESLDQIELGSLSAFQRRAIFDQLTQAVVAMHAHGIVHGAIDLKTVLLDPTGRVHVTHVSPLLYDDPEIDLAAVRNLGGALSQTAPLASVDETASTDRLRTRQRLFAGLTLVGGALIFVGLLWYSLGR